MDDERLRHLTRWAREVFAGNRGEFRVSHEAREIVHALKDVLEASVELFDVEKRMRHLAMTSSRWLSYPDDPSDAARAGCFVRARINDRWTLCLYRGRHMHPDAQSIARWAA